MAPRLDNDPNDGTCKICGESYTYAGMTRHVKSCVPDGDDGSESPEWLHLRMRAVDFAEPPCWLHLAVHPDARLAHFDEYLRDQWYVERHPALTSYFQLTRTIYASHPDRTEHPSEPVRSMDIDVKEVIHEGTEVRYKFRTPEASSMAKGKVYGRLPVPEDSSSDAVRTLARNHLQTFDCIQCSAREADFRCLDCYEGVCRSCAEDGRGDHRLHSVENTPLKVTPEPFESSRTRPPND